MNEIHYESCLQSHGAANIKRTEGDPKQSPVGHHKSVEMTQKDTKSLFSFKKWLDVAFSQYQLILQRCGCRFLWNQFETPDVDNEELTVGPVKT